MKKGTKIVLLVVLIVVCVGLLAAVLPFRIAPAAREDWLASHRAEELGTEPVSAQLLDTYTEGGLEVQLWRVAGGDGAEFYDAVAWQRGLLGRWRVLHTQWAPRQEDPDWWMSFGFQCGLHWYSFDVTLSTETLAAPRKSFRL